MSTNKICLSSCLLFLALVSTTTSTTQTTPQKYHHELTIKYFTDVSMVCDHPGLNVTESRDIRSISWLFPDGTMVDAGSPLNPRIYAFSGPESTSAPGPVFSSYNLTALSVDDNVFGYYTCVVVYNRQDRLPDVIRWGLNVDGADFSELLETYKTNAIIGGCAAAAMLLVVGGGCLIWNIRKSKGGEDEEDEGSADSDLKSVAEVKVQGHGQNNHAYSSDIEITTSIDNYTETKSDINVKM
ncbi:hypothetical protein Btru_055546 [Bulinus truncatus]|nr:hypothetical protein Btru_055546 [Bulinus truncatus]